MDINNVYDLMKEYALDNENYKKWRKIHGDAFGDIFLSAFEGNDEAQIRLTAALNKTTKREVEKALDNLKSLEYFCNNDFDNGALCYFIGLNYELLQNEEKVNEYYDKMQEYNQNFLFNVSFHPYYYTAKAAQKNSDCKKSVAYYQKAISFYDDKKKTEEIFKILAQLYFEIATVYTYKHEYEKGSFYIQRSFDCDKTPNMQRNYVLAILCALDEKRDMLNRLLDSMPGILKINCSQITEAILNKTDLHYCVVGQDRSNYKEFRQLVKECESEIAGYIEKGEIRKAEEKISKYLTQSLPFMNRELDCRVEKTDEQVLVKCKNYYTKTLIEEYKALFSSNEESEQLVFVSVNEF